MYRRYGFTLVELMITITIMVILLTLTVVSLRSSQANARDEKRKTDIENIARGLENRYRDGNSRATASYALKGSYPSTNEILHAQGQSMPDFTPAQISQGYLTDLLPGTTKESFIPPGNSGAFAPICTGSCQPAGTQSVIDAATTTNKYIYEPIDRSNNVCIATDCVRYNLYFRTETNNTVQTVRSKNQ